MRNFSPWEHFLAELRQAGADDPCPVDDPGALAAWRLRFPDRLAALLGPLPDPVPLAAEVTDSVDCGTFRRDRVVYDSERHMSVPAYLLVPHDRAAAGAPPGPAVLAQHGHGPGKDEVCGVVEPDGPNDYARQLAERGYVVLAPDLRAFGERADLVPPDKYACDLGQVHMAMLGRNVLALDMWDLRCGIDFLCSLPFVDPERIGMVGLSQGGTMTLFMAAWDARIRAAVVSGYFGAWSTSATIPWNMCGSQVLFGMLGRIEHLDLAAAVAPRALMVESGGDDPIFPAPVAVHEWDRLRRVYAALGAPDACALDVFEGGHQWNGRRAWPFLETWL